MGLPELATSRITPKHLALNSPAAICLVLPVLIELVGVFFVATFELI
jgi:hypothetical protein